MLEIGRVSGAAHEEQGLDGVLLADVLVLRGVEDGIEARDAERARVRRAVAQVGAVVVRLDGGVRAGVMRAGEEGGRVAGVRVASGIGRRTRWLNGHWRCEGRGAAALEGAAQAVG